MTDMKPKDSVKLDIVKLDKSETYPEEKVLPEGVLYRYLYQPDEQHRDQKRRATDVIWNKNTYRLDQLLQQPGNRVSYYLQYRSDRDFVREESIHILEYTQVPLERVSKWKKRAFFFLRCGDCAHNSKLIIKIFLN